MKKKVIFLTIVSSFFALCFICYAEEAVTSSELINNAKQYDGKAVMYTGEVIGDVMVRGKFAWINVNDGVNAIGIWSNKDLVEDIIYVGNYKTRGDTVEIKGIFHRACLEHGGDLDIHIESLRKINSGEAVKEKTDIAKKNTALILFAALCIIAALSRLKSRRLNEIHR